VLGDFDRRRCFQLSCCLRLGTGGAIERLIVIVDDPARRA
jgi:hypothetical protein